MSDLAGLVEEFETLKAHIADVEASYDALPASQERLNEVAVLIKQDVSDPAIEPEAPEILIDETAEPVTLSEPIKPMTDFSGFDYGATPNGYAPAAPETD